MGFSFGAEGKGCGEMGETFTMSGIKDWLETIKLKKVSISIEERIKTFKKISKETLRGSGGEKRSQTNQSDTRNLKH